jgi:hypothetical protein
LVAYEHATRGLFDTSWLKMVLSTIRSVSIAGMSMARSVATVAATAAGPLAAQIAFVVMTIVIEMLNSVIGMLCRWLGALLGVEVGGAINLAIAAHRAYAKGAAPAFRMAAMRAARKVVADRVQLEEFTDAAVRVLKGEGWKTVVTPEVRTSPLVTPDPGLPNAMKSRWERHQNFVDKVSDLLDQAKALQDQDDRLAQSVPKLEQYLDMLRNSQNKLARGEYDKMDKHAWSQARIGATNVGWGRAGRNYLAKFREIQGKHARGNYTPAAQELDRKELNSLWRKRRGGMGSRIKHVSFKAARDCQKLKKAAVAITRRGIKRAAMFIARGGTGGDGTMGVIDMVVGYQLTRWVSSQKKGDKVAVTQKAGIDRIELKSNQKSDSALGVETLDSGIKGPPGLISEPIAKAGLRAVSTILGWT